MIEEAQMPFIHLSITRKLEADEKARLADGIAKLVSLIPGKPYEKTMVRIDDGCEIFRAGKKADCAFMQTQMKKPCDHEKAVEYTEKLYKLFEETLGLPAASVYFNIIETDYWGSRGTLH